MTDSGPRHLPYTDEKPEGAADFYFAINATFRFLLKHFGTEGWKAWLREMGRNYYAPVNQRWREGGLAEVAAYWKDFFDAEPGGNVGVATKGDEVHIEVRQCPAIKHLKDAGREIVPCYCQHCGILGQARAREAGLSMEVVGGDGSCRHVYGPDGRFDGDVSRIRKVSP